MKLIDLLKIFLIATVVSFSMISIVQVYKHITQPDWYGWPAVTQCRACDKTVWEWQDYERRSFDVGRSGNSNILLSITMSGLVHTECKGTPSIEIGINKD